MNWKEIFKEGAELVLVTYSEESGPHAIVVMSEGFIGDKLLINACQTQTTLTNLKKDSRVSVVAMNSGKYLRLKGVAELHDRGKPFEIAKKRNEGTKFEVKCAIIIKIDEIFDLDKVKILSEKEEV